MDITCSAVSVVLMRVVGISNNCLFDLLYDSQFTNLCIYPHKNICAWSCQLSIWVPCSDTVMCLPRNCFANAVTLMKWVEIVAPKKCSAFYIQLFMSITVVIALNAVIILFIFHIIVIISISDCVLFILMMALIMSLDKMNGKQVIKNYSPEQEFKLFTFLFMIQCNCDEGHNAL